MKELSRVDLHVGFVAAGMATTLLGPVLPALAQRWGVSDALIGLAFTVQFLGTVSMSALSSALVIRLGGGRVMLAGFVLLAAGIGGLTVAPWGPGLAAILCYGFGLGLVLPTTNVLIAAASPGREASAVSLVNVSWSGGAVAWPVLVAYLGGGQRVGLPLAVLALLMAVMATRLMLMARHGAADGFTPVSSAIASRVFSPGGQAPALQPDGGRGTAILVATFSAMLFFYAGAESAIGGWVAEHVRRIEGSGAGRQWTIAPMVFWAALALGRLLTPLVLRGLAEPRVLVSALTVVLAASTLLVSGRICAGCVRRRRGGGARSRAGIPHHFRRPVTHARTTPTRRGGACLRDGQHRQRGAAMAGRILFHALRHAAGRAGGADRERDRDDGAHRHSPEAGAPRSGLTSRW